MRAMNRERRWQRIRRYGRAPAGQRVVDHVSDNLGNKPIQCLLRWGLTGLPRLRGASTVPSMVTARIISLTRIIKDAPGLW